MMKSVISDWPLQTNLWCWHFASAVFFLLSWKLLWNVQYWSACTWQPVRQRRVCEGGFIFTHVVLGLGWLTIVWGIADTLDSNYRDGDLFRRFKYLLEDTLRSAKINDDVSRDVSVSPVLYPIPTLITCCLTAEHRSLIHLIFSYPCCWTDKSVTVFALETRPRIKLTKWYSVVFIRATSLHEYVHCCSPQSTYTCTAYHFIYIS